MIASASAQETACPRGQKVHQQEARLSNGLRYLIASCCLTLFASAAALSAETIPAGTPLEIRIQQPISSYSTPAGTKITGVLVSPVNEGGSLLIPLGTTIQGSVAAVRKGGIGV